MSTVKLTEMVEKLCKVTDQESVFVQAGFLRELESSVIAMEATIAYGALLTKLALVQSELAQSDEKRANLSVQLLAADKELVAARRTLDILRKELGMAHETIAENKSRFDSQVRSLEEDLKTAIDLREYTVVDTEDTSEYEVTKP